MTTLRDDLGLALSWAQTTYPNTPSEIVLDAREVYINYGYRTAVCLGCEYAEAGKVWYATATSWDRTGGVSDEREIDRGSSASVFQSVTAFLMQQAVDEEKLERLLDERPED